MNAEIVIHFLGTKEEIMPTLKSYFHSQAVQLKAYNHQELEDVEYLLLIEPIKIYSKHYSLSSIWKNWLLDRYPLKKLIIAGFIESNHPNVLNLLDMPLNLRSWLKKTYCVGFFTFQAGTTKNSNGMKNYEYNDTWENYPLPLGINIKGELERFLVGHSHDNFIEKLSLLKKRVSDNLDLLPAGKIVDSKLREELINYKIDISSILRRWKNYKDFFRYLPFFNFVSEIMIELKLLVQQIDDACNDDFSSRIDKRTTHHVSIREEIEEKVSRFIHYKDCW